MAWDLFVRDYKDHPVTRDDENGSTAVELTAMYLELVVDSLFCFANFAMEKYWRSSDVARRQLQGTIQFLSNDGTNDQMNLDDKTALKELATQFQSYAGAYFDGDNVSWSDSRSGSRRAGDVLAAFLPDRGNPGDAACSSSCWRTSVVA